MTTTWVIVANGAPPPRHTLAQMIRGNNAQICACDGAANWLTQHQWPIDVIIGDGDSISQAVRETHQHLIVIDSDQNTTDSEKAIRYCRQHGAQQIVLLGGFGGRLDHTMYQLRLLHRYYDRRCPIVAHNTGETLRLVRDQEILLNGKPGQHVAILGAPNAIIDAPNLTYACHQFTVGYGHRESSSNSLSGHQCSVMVQGSAFLITDELITVSMEATQN